MSYEVLRTVVVKRSPTRIFLKVGNERFHPARKDGESRSSVAIGEHARRLCRSAMCEGALYFDILRTDVEEAYCYILWPSERSWQDFKKARGIRKVMRRNLWLLTVS